MRHTKHRPPRGTRVVLAVLSLIGCAALTLAISTSAAAVTTTQLQYNLAGLAYMPLSCIDGKTGPNTTAATKAFQKDACITADGVDGPQTDAALAAKIKQVQAVAHTTQDGAYGPTTKAAVATWQRAHGLTADGVAGPTTMKAMGVARTCAPPPPPGPVRGVDVSSYQGNVNWSTAYANGARFAYVKAVEATDYINPYFAQQYNGAASAGVIRGAYDFARPNLSSGTVQADYFVSHGGAWTADGTTLPPALDIEYNPYTGNSCYDLSQTAMVSWIAAFSNEVHARTTRYPVIYTTTDWWTTCTGNSAAFASTNPLWIARYASTVGTLPAGWATYTIWQNADAGTLPGDQNVFNGTFASVQALAVG